MTHLFWSNKCFYCRSSIVKISAAVIFKTSLSKHPLLLLSQLPAYSTWVEKNIYKQCDPILIFSTIHRTTCSLLCQSTIFTFGLPYFVMTAGIINKKLIEHCIPFQDAIFLVSCYCKKKFSIHK